MKYKANIKHFVSGENLLCTALSSSGQGEISIFRYRIYSPPFPIFYSKYFRSRYHLSGCKWESLECKLPGRTFDHTAYISNSDTQYNAARNRIRQELLGVDNHRQIARFYLCFPDQIENLIRKYNFCEDFFVPH